MTSKADRTGGSAADRRAIEVSLVATRVLAYSAGALGSLAWIPLINQADFDTAMWSLLVGFAAAGAILGFRLSLLSIGREDPADIAGVDRAVIRGTKPTVIDLGVLLAISVVVGEIVLIATGDANEWFLPLFVSLFLVGLAALVGIVFGMLVVSPIGMLARAASQRASGRPVATGTVIVAILLLAVITFAAVTVSALSRSPGEHADLRSEVFPAIFTVVTGIPLGGDQVGLPVLAWLARGLAVVVIIMFALLARARAKAREELTSPDHPKPKEAPSPLTFGQFRRAGERAGRVAIVAVVFGYIGIAVYLILLVLAIIQAVTHRT
ncbi:MAG: hypothetical protein ABI435_00935 [Pseudolysinimonas sp.]